ncbi:MAG: single-stranded DNA-binding protein [Tissierellia bacterium]|nr:single-stranded DNA-binding protein [Tissierellia bacterium]
MNEVRLYGRIAMDLPNIEELTNKPLYFALAVDKFIAGEKDVDYIPVKVWGKLAKNICEYKTKGDELIVSGRLGVAKFEKNGQKMHVLEVTANSVTFVGSRKKDVTQEQIDNANADAAELQKKESEQNVNNFDTNNFSTNQKESFSSEPKNDELSSLGFSSKDDEDFFLNAIGGIDNPFA